MITEKQFINKQSGCPIQKNKKKKCDGNKFL